MSRADKFTGLSKTPIYYSDFTDNFSLNPQTGYLAILTNADSIKNSIRNLCLTNRLERLYQPGVGSKIQSLLFDLNDLATQQLLITTIHETINNYEPRALNLQVIVNQVIDENQIAITVVFSMVNIVDPVSFTLILKRVR